MEFLPPPPPQAPRPVTPFANRRAWSEPPARLWWLSAVVIGLILLGYVVFQMLERRRVDWLIHHGVPTTGTIVRTVLHSIPGQTVEAKELIDIRFPFKGADYPSQGFLSQGSEVGAKIPIHVDPDDPSFWTDRTHLGPVLDEMFVDLIAAAGVPALLLLAWLRKRSRLKVWQTGEAKPAVVVGRGQSPIAPLSHVVRCSLPGSADKTVFAVFLPRSSSRPEKGDSIWVVVPADGGGPVAADWFTERS